MSKTFTVAVVGATGAVGLEMLNILDQRRFPLGQVRALASARSVDRRVKCGQREIIVEELREDSFKDVQIALFSPGGKVSKQFAPLAAKAGAYVIDNTSAFRQDAQVPLIVPEVNADAIGQAERQRIIANPNCSTIQVVVALNPLRRAAGIKRLVMSTYQSVSGAGAKGLAELAAQAQAWAREQPLPPASIFPQQILFNCLPQIGEFTPAGYCVEEEKMVNETRKIFAEPEMRITATTVRVPVLVGHSISVNVELAQPLALTEARTLLQNAPGVTLVDDLSTNSYPLATMAAGTDPVYVGRVRRDLSVDYGYNLWVVADNLRKGAALNAVQIAEILVKRDMV